MEYNRRLNCYTGTRLCGKHYTAPKKDLKLNNVTARIGLLHKTLTRARRSLLPGMAIIRVEDGKVVAVK